MYYLGRYQMPAQSGWVKQSFALYYLRFVDQIFPPTVTLERHVAFEIQEHSDVSPTLRDYA